MSLRPNGTYALGMTAILTSATLMLAKVVPSAQSSSASHVAAEVTKGSLNSAESKPGDTVVVELKGDVKSNGEVVLKKGATITGVVRVVRNVKSAPVNSAARGDAKAQSMMEIEWLAPAVQGRAAQTLSIALQSVMQLSPVYPHDRGNAEDNFGPVRDGAAAAVARPAPANGPMVASRAVLGNTVDSVVGPKEVEVASSTSARASVLLNPALLSMPSVVAVDDATSSTLGVSLGTSPSGPLFKVGHGRLVTASGLEQILDIFSHLNNDTVITSASKDFEISSGAQMQLLVGVNKK